MSGNSSDEESVSSHIESQPQEEQELETPAIGEVAEASLETGQDPQGPVDIQGQTRRRLSFGAEESQEEQGISRGGQGLQASINPGTMSDSTNNPVSVALPTVHDNVADMFQDVTDSPIAEEKFARGSCEVPRSARGTDPKVVAKIKERCVAPLPEKFDMPYYMVSSQFGENEGAHGNQVQSASQAIISVAYRCSELMIRAKAFDLLNILLIPRLKDATKTKPSDVWDFSHRDNLLESYGSISRERAELWTKYMYMWSKSPELEAQDQEWLLELVRNSTTPQLKVKLARTFEKLDGCCQGGVTYLWLLLNFLVKVNSDVAEGLQEVLKNFKEKGLYKYRGESVEDARIEIEAVCTHLQ